MTPIPEKEQFLTLAEVRARLRVSRATLYRLTHDHGLRVVKCGGVVRIRERDLVAWVEKHTTGNGDDRVTA